MQTSLQQKIGSVVETPFQQDVSGLKIVPHKQHWRSHPACEQGSGLSNHLDLVSDEFCHNLGFRAFSPSPIHQRHEFISAASWSCCWHPPARAEGEVQFQESDDTFSLPAGWAFPRWPVWEYWGWLGCWH